MIRPKITGVGNRKLSPASKVMAFLCYTGQTIFMKTTGDVLGMSVSAVSKTIKDVAIALAELAPEVLKFPDEEVALLPVYIA